MAYTSHGHHIPGTILDEPKPTSVARCGGVKMCRVCRAYADEYLLTIQKLQVEGKPTPPIGTKVKATLRFLNGSNHFDVDIPCDSSGAPILPEVRSAIGFAGLTFIVTHHSWDYNPLPNGEIGVTVFAKA